MAPVPRIAELVVAAARRGPGRRPDEVAHDALWLQRCIAAAALASATSFVPVHEAGAAGAQLGVTVTVPLVAAMQVHYQVPTITIGLEDIRRGFVEVAAGSRFSVATTSRDGYLVDLVPRLAVFRSVEVVMAGARAEFGPEGGTLVARGRPRRDPNAEITYRFRIADGVAPGVYPFPLDLAVRPL